MTLTNPTPRLRLARPNFNVFGWHDEVNDNFVKLDAAAGLTGAPSIDGVWENNTAFTINQRIVDATDASVWLCNVNHTSILSGSFADDRAAHPSYWSLIDSGLTIRGAWVSGATYNTYDLVFDTSEHIVAYANTAHVSTSNIRVDIANWNILADLKASVTAAAASAQSAADSAAEAAAIVGGDIASIINGAPSLNPPQNGDKFMMYDVSGDVVASLTWLDVVTAFNSTYAPAVHTHAWADIVSGTPTTVAGYGITNAYTKTEVDTMISGVAVGMNKRATSRVATTGNIVIATALNAGDSIDGVVLADGDYVLVKNQSAPAENGVYVAGVTPARAPEFDAWAEFPGALVAIQEGAANADTMWLCTTNTGGTIGVTAIAWSKLQVAGELLAANNLSDLQNAGTARTNLGLGAAATLAVATAAQFRSNTASLVLGPQGAWGAADSVNLGATLNGNLTLDMNNFIHADGTVTGNLTFNAISNLKSQGGIIELTASGGPWTVSFNSSVFCTAGNISLGTLAAGTITAFSYRRLKTGKVLLTRIGVVT